jgi:hypothetical protein
MSVVRASIGFAVLAAACSPAATPGMAPSMRRPYAADRSLDELARVAPASDARPLLVVHPRVACSGSAPMVFLDDHGTFYGSVAPGEAALLEVPKNVAKLQVVSSVEITAPVRSWFVTSEVDVPPFPDGLLLGPRRVSARECLSTGQYADAAPTTKSKLEDVLAVSELTWLEPRIVDGQRWIDRHRARVHELLARGPGLCPASLFGAPSYCAEALTP